MSHVQCGSSVSRAECHCTHKVVEKRYRRFQLVLSVQEVGLSVRHVIARRYVIGWFLLRRLLSVRRSFGNMGLLTILKKMKQKEREVRLLMLYPMAPGGGHCVLPGVRLHTHLSQVNTEYIGGDVGDSEEPVVRFFQCTLGYIKRHIRVVYGSDYIVVGAECQDWRQLVNGP